MLRTFLIFVLIFVASTSFASEQSVQNDKSTSAVLCNIDSQTGLNQDFDDIEFDIAPANQCLSISNRATEAPNFSNVSPYASTQAHTAIRAPPYHYH
jgi:hypothetical protein